MASQSSTLALVALAASTLHAQTLAVTPSRALIDQTAVIRASGLEPREHAVLKAGLTDGANQRWESEAEFEADAHGVIDASATAPVKGSYKGVSGMGLIWSMKPAAKNVTVYRAPPQLQAQKIDFELVRAGNSAAHAQLEQAAAAEGIREINVSGTLHGQLFLPAGNGPFPGLLVLGGSEGGLPRRRAALFASHGYAAFALAYFHYENLPPALEAIPLEYFGAALEWMTTRPEIAPGRIGVMGVSRGAELALQLGSMFPRIKAVVAYAPSAVRHRSCCGGNLFPYAWTWQGSPLAFAALNLHGPDALAAIIHVEQTNGPILLIAGDQDHIWDSSGAAREIVARLTHNHFAPDVESFVYPHAGHIAGRPEIIPEWHGQLTHPISGRPTDYGGTPEGNALSSIDAIPRVLDFVRRSLGAGAN